MPIDGLNNVNYTLVGYNELPLHTNITIRVNIDNAKKYLGTIGYKEKIHMNTKLYTNHQAKKNKIVYTLSGICFVRLLWIFW